MTALVAAEEGTEPDRWRVDVEVDVRTVVGHAEPVRLRGWAMGPAAPTDGPVPVLYCQAGGSCSTGYFDLRVPGHDGYSMAEDLAGRGAVVIALDHLGLGTSDPYDLFAVTPSLLAACHHHAATELAAALRHGSLDRGIAPVAAPVLVGLGHSMGAMLTTVQQGRHATFAALVLLGHGGTGLPEVLTPEELAVRGPDLASIEPEIVRLAHVRFGEGTTVERKKPARGSFFTADVPQAVRRAFAEQSVPGLPVGGLTSMIPDSVHAEKAAITVPVFLGFGDDDLIDDYTGTAAQFPASRDLAIYVLADSGHCQNQAAGRQTLWRRTAAWVDAVVADVDDRA